MLLFSTVFMFGVDVWSFLVHICRLFLEVRKVKFFNFFLLMIINVETQVNIISKKNFENMSFLLFFETQKSLKT